MLERIIYVSRVAAGVELADVTGLLKAARERNAAEDISGGLVFHDGWFVQVLEGPRDVVGETFARIERDPRHVDLVLRSRERALCRLFAGQSMGLRTGTGLDPAVMREFEYKNGFSVEEFPVDELLEFMVHICWPERGCVGMHKPVTRVAGDMDLTPAPEPARRHIGLQTFRRPSSCFPQPGSGHKGGAR